MPEIDEQINKNKKRKNKDKTKISFDEEVVTKDSAKYFINEDDHKTVEKAEIKPHREKKRKIKMPQETSKKEVQSTKKLKADNNTEDTEAASAGTEPSAQPIGAKKESIRSLKRQKHAQLVANNKIKVELELQQKSLNYLSKWKHSKSEWKFEKLRQVWIQQNLFDSSKIPDEFWETTVHYFSGAKGQSRQAVLEQAIKYIEDEDKSVEDNESEDYLSKLKRARDIVQNMQ